MDEKQRSPLLLHIPVPPAEQCERLRVAVEFADSRSAESLAALHDAVREFTVVMKAEGINPEHVLLALKSVIYNRSFPMLAVHATEWASGSRLHEKISTWCIEEFFKEKTA